MSKNILFRGQTRKKGEKVTMSGTPIPSNWVFGGIFPQNNGGDFAIIYQQDPEIQKFPVYAETVCQYTGKNDKYGGKIFENDIITYVANINASDVPCKGNVFYSETLAAYMVTVKADASHSPDRDNDSYLIPASIPLSECGNIVVIGNVFDGEYELPEKVKNAPTKSNNGFIVQEYILDLNDIGKNDEKKIRAQFDELFQRTNTVDSYRLLAELSIEIGYFSPVCGIFFETMGDAVSYIKTKTNVDMTIVQSDKTNLEMIRTLDKFNLAMLLNHICTDSKNRPSSTTGWYEWLGNNWNFMT